MKCLVVILGLLVAAVQADHGENFSDGSTPLIVSMSQMERTPNFRRAKFVGGRPARPGQFPHQAAIVVSDSSFCGGSLISQNYVLTSAYCAQMGATFTVRLGCIEWKEYSCTRITTTIRIVHPNFNPSTLANNIALLRLPTAAPINNDIRPVALPQQRGSNTYAGETAIVSGFGATSEAGGISPTLNYADLVIISNVQCSQYYGSIIETSTICASGAEGKSPFSGDSGAALVVGNVGSYTQIGILSFASSAGCGDSYPAVYTRVTSFVSWIQSTTGL